MYLLRRVIIYTNEMARQLALSDAKSMALQHDGYFALLCLQSSSRHYRGTRSDSGAFLHLPLGNAAINISLHFMQSL